MNQCWVDRRFRTTDDHIFTFSGNSTVTFKCVEETDLILIHSHKLNYTSSKNAYGARLTALNSRETAPSIKFIWLQPVTQYLVIELNGKLTKGWSYDFFIKFTGELADDLGGFYRSEYEEDGVTKYVHLVSILKPTEYITSLRLGIHKQTSKNEPTRMNILNTFLNR